MLEALKRKTMKTEVKLSQKNTFSKTDSFFKLPTLLKK